MKEITWRGVSRLDAVLQVEADGRAKEGSGVFCLPLWKLAQGESQDFPRPAATVAVARTMWDRHVTLFYNCLCYANVTLGKMLWFVVTL